MISVLTEKESVGVRVQTHGLQILFMDLVEDHLVDVFEFGRRETRVRGLTAPAHQQIGFIYRHKHTSFTHRAQERPIRSVRRRISDLCCAADSSG